MKKLEIKNFYNIKLYSLRNIVVLILVFTITVMFLLMQKRENLLKENRNWLELEKCYSSNYSSLDELKTVSPKLYSERNLWEVNQLTQNVHSGFYNTYQDLAKRAFVANKYRIKNFNGIPTYREIFGDKLNISDLEVGEFLDNNPNLLSNSAQSAEERKKLVQDHLFNTKLTEQIKEYLIDYNNKELENPYFIPCPPKVNFPKNTGILISSNDILKNEDLKERIDFIVNPVHPNTRKGWIKLQNLLAESSHEREVRIHLFGGEFSDLEITAQCLISGGGLPWQAVLRAVMESPVTNPKDQLKSIQREVSKLRIIDEKSNSECIENSVKYRSNITNFKALATSVFKEEFKYRPYLFINEKLFVHYERGENPYIVEKYLSKR
jgi:hypothetical protein